MDQHKRKGQQSDPPRGQGPHGQSDSQRPDQQKWNQSQNPIRDDTDPPRHDTPGRDEGGQQWTRDQTGGQKPPPDYRSRNQGRQDSPSATGGRQKDAGSHGERNVGGDISNRGLDREMEEQDELPDRGSRQSER